jgi:putative transposase
MGEHIDIAALAAACSGLGIAIDTLPPHLRAPAADDAAQPRAQDIPLALTDAEWAILAPLLPPEPPQADAMSQRELLDKVIWVIARGRRWTALDAAHEAVRRKFGRWAHAGVWQQLYADASGVGALHPQRLLHLQRIAQRAAALSGKRPRSGG